MRRSTRSPETTYEDFLEAFTEPTVLADVPKDALCAQEETFAPVAAISSFGTEEEAIAMANDTIHGLSAYAFTADLDRGR